MGGWVWQQENSGIPTEGTGMGICAELHCCVVLGWHLDLTHLISFSARCLLSSSSSFLEEKAQVQKGWHMQCHSASAAELGFNPKSVSSCLSWCPVLGLFSLASYMGTLTESLDLWDTWLPRSVKQTAMQCRWFWNAYQASEKASKH